MGRLTAVGGCGVRVVADLPWCAERGATKIVKVAVCLSPAEVHTAARLVARRGAGRDEGVVRTRVLCVECWTIPGVWWPRATSRGGAARLAGADSAGGPARLTPPCEPGEADMAYRLAGRRYETRISRLGEAVGPDEFGSQLEGPPPSGELRESRRSPSVDLESRPPARLAGRNGPEALDADTHRRGKPQRR